MTDLAFASAAELARLIATRALSSVERVEMVLAPSSARNRCSTPLSP